MISEWAFVKIFVLRLFHKRLQKVGIWDSCEKVSRTASRGKNKKNMTRSESLLYVRGMSEVRAGMK